MSMIINPYRFAGGGGGGGGGDPYWANVVLLLHCDGTDGSTTFPDASDSDHTVTANGNAQVNTAQQKFGTGSFTASTTGANLAIADSADWHFAAGDFTIEFFARFPSLAGNPELFSQREAATIPPITIYRIGTGISVYISFNNITWVAIPTIASGAVLSVDTWHYIALTREGSSFKLWVDGSQVGSTYTSASSFTDYDKQLQIGGGPARSTLAGAWMDEIRITKGVARDVSTVPTSAFPDS